MNIPTLHPLSHLPISTGIGMRMPHYSALCDDASHQAALAYQPAWLEVHPENYFCGGYHRHYLEQAAEKYALSFHAIGLSLGSSEPVDSSHLASLKELVDAFNPAVISDHVSWSRSGNAHLNDLLPLAYTPQNLEAIATNIDHVQQTLGRKILVENPSTYLTFKESTMQEADFLMEITHKAECGLLLDVNNIFVQAHNNGLNAQEYIRTIEPNVVGEIHLAGHIEQPLETGGSLLIDSHSQPVKADVWQLYDEALNHLGPTPTLIEWDSDIPELATLLGEAEKADALLQAKIARGHHAA